MLPLIAACGFEPGLVREDATDVDDPDAPIAPPEDAGAGSEPAPPGEVMFVGGTTGGAADSNVVMVPSTMTGGATYVLAVATRPYRRVMSVVGLGASWVEVGDQCGARSQTGAALFVARTPVFSGQVVITLEAAADNATAALGAYVNSAGSGVTMTYNALDATTCSEPSPAADLASYSFSIATNGGLVVAGIATRGRPHAPGAGLGERLERCSAT